MEAEKALEIDANLWMTHFGAAFAYLLLERLREARESAEEAARLAPWNPLLPRVLAGVLALAGETQQAEQLLANRLDTSGPAMVITKPYAGTRRALSKRMPVLSHREIQSRCSLLLPVS